MWFGVYFLTEESGRSSRDCFMALFSIMAFVTLDRKPVWGFGQLLSMCVSTKSLGLEKKQRMGPRSLWTHHETSALPSSLTSPLE